jgi:hypothetical protein
MAFVRNCRFSGISWHDTHTKFRENWFRHSGNTEDFTPTIWESYSVDVADGKDLCRSEDLKWHDILTKPSGYQSFSFFHKFILSATALPYKTSSSESRLHNPLRKTIPTRRDATLVTTSFIHQWLYSTLLGPGRFVSFVIMCMVSRTPWKWVVTSSLMAES